MTSEFQIPSREVMYLNVISHCVNTEGQFPSHWFLSSLASQDLEALSGHMTQNWATLGDSIPALMTQAVPQHSFVSCHGWFIVALLTLLPQSRTLRFL